MSEQDIQKVKSKYGWVSGQKTQNDSKEVIATKNREFVISDFHADK
jgi:hypothetical protein